MSCEKGMAQVMVYISVVDVDTGQLIAYRCLLKSWCLPRSPDSSSLSHRRGPMTKVLVVQTVHWCCCSRNKALPGVSFLLFSPPQATVHMLCSMRDISLAHAAR